MFARLRNFGLFLFAPALLGVTRIKAAVMGAVLRAIGMDAVYKKLLEKQA